MPVRSRALDRVTHLLVVFAAASPVPATLIGGGLATQACFKTGPSNVAQGLRYAAGEPSYDGFFDRFYQVQLMLAQAPDREVAVRRELAVAVGSTDISPEPLLAATGKHTERMKAAGLTIALKVAEDTTPPTAELEVTAGLAEAEDQRVIAAIADAAKAEAALAAELEASKADVARLKEQVPMLLERIGDTFRKEGPGKKSEVRDNLQDAQRLVPLMEQRSSEIGATSRQMIDGLVAVANTTAPPPETPPAEPEKPAPTKKGRIGAGASAPPAKPRKSPATSSDGFEP
jgi:hypothetical protein